MIIQHNIMALNAHRQLGGNNGAVSKNLEKLSSGFRINRAGDDAAGLAISEKMRSQIKGLERAQANAQDGISLVQTAEGALTEVHSMLNRLVELGTESANGTIQASDRQKIQDEVDALTGEIDRISKATNFNGIKLLDGSLAGTTEGKLTGGIIVNYVNKTAATAGQDLSAAVPGDFDLSKKDKITVDGTEISVDWSKLTADELKTLSVDHSTASSTASAEVMTKYINASIDQYNKDNGTDVKHVKVELATAATGYTFTSGSTKSDGKISFTGLSTANTDSVLGKLFSTASAGATTSTPGFVTGAAKPANTTDTFKMNLNGTSIQITTTNAGAGGTGAGGLAAALQTDIQAALTNYIASTGTTDFKATDITVTMTKDGKLEVKGQDGQKISFSDDTGSLVAQKMGLTNGAGAAGAGGLTLQIGDTADDFNKVTVSVADMSSTGLGINGIKVTDAGLSADTITNVNKAVELVSTARGKLGALQNRLEHTINNLGVTTENMTAAESRIRDVDMAKEMMSFTKNNVLTQAAQAMLAQANQQPQQVLQLLR